MNSIKMAPPTCVWSEGGVQKVLLHKNENYKKTYLWPKTFPFDVSWVTLCHCCTVVVAVVVACERTLSVTKSQNVCASNTTSQVTGDAHT